MSITEKQYFDGSHFKLGKTLLDDSKKEINHPIDGYDVKLLIVKLGMRLDSQEIKQMAPVLLTAILRDSDSDFKIIC